MRPAGSRTLPWSLLSRTGGGHRAGAPVVAGPGPALPEDTVAEIVERGAGAPLLVEELASLAPGSGHLLRVPDVVRAIVRERAGAP